MNNNKYTFFWGKGSPFSQWHPCNFIVGETEFNCAEQYMMHQKALLFGDEKTGKKILRARDPGKQKHLGREVRRYDDKIWRAKRELIVYDGNHAKFIQNADLYKALMDTRGTVLVEASPSDSIWGIGLSAEDPRAKDEANWRGMNLLGKILTRLRDNFDSRRAEK